MQKVLLINQEKTPHYRVAVYRHMATYLLQRGYELTIVSEGIPQSAGPPAADGSEIAMKLTTASIVRLINRLKPDAIIYWIRLRHSYLFPTLFYSKLKKIKLIYWGHGTDLSNKKAMWLKRFANETEYKICDALILYGERLKKHVCSRHHNKTFIANNTMHFPEHNGHVPTKESVLSKYKIDTKKNIICMGRMQARKRIHALVEAFKRINQDDIGLVLVGPDTEGIIDDAVQRLPNVYYLGEIYGDERLDILSACDVYCLPGAIGLSIVDAFHCGLPIVTEEGGESPELMYLKPGKNGFLVPRGDSIQLAAKLTLLMDDNNLRNKFSEAARHEIDTNGHIDTMCSGFYDALQAVTPIPSIPFKL